MGGANRPSSSNRNSSDSKPPSSSGNSSKAAATKKHMGSKAKRLRLATASFLDFCATWPPSEPNISCKARSYRIPVLSDGQFQCFAEALEMRRVASTYREQMHRPTLMTCGAKLVWAFLIPCLLHSQMALNSFLAFSMMISWICRT